MWGFLFYEAYWDKIKQGGKLKAGKIRITTSNFDTKNCVALISRSLMGITELVEKRNRSQLLGYSQLNHYLCACLKLLKKQRYAYRSVISKDQIKSENFCMLVNMFH